VKLLTWPAAPQLHILVFRDIVYHIHTTLSSSFETVHKFLCIYGSVPHFSTTPLLTAGFKQRKGACRQQQAPSFQLVHLLVQLSLRRRRASRPKGRPKANRVTVTGSGVPLILSAPSYCVGGSSQWAGGVLLYE